jgi:putative membrane protein
MLWVKAFHIIAVICWFAAIFYLPRLFVYHAMLENITNEDKPTSERFKVMERKLYRGIMTPSMIAVIILGGWLMSYNFEYYLSQGWIQAKLILVALLVVYHNYCGHLMCQFRDDKNTKSHKFYRIFNEVPVFMLVAIVILAVVRPF